MSRYILLLSAFLATFSFSIQTADATLVFEASGVSAAGVDVSFEADLSISGDTLTIVLINTSPVDSLYKADPLGSFYFDIVNSVGDRPDLVYSSAVGDLYTGNKNGPDPLYQANADLKSMSGGKGWVFRTMDEMYVPYLGFGIGTVGNSNLTPNNFPSMNGIETAIYKGEVTTQSLHGYWLVKGTATFTFTGLAGFTEADILPEFAFGLGTAPDSLLTPEPATLAILALGSLFLRSKRLFRR